MLSMTQGALVVKHLPANAEDMRGEFDPWVGKIPWRRAWQPLQYPCLEDPMAGGAWWATVHGVVKSQTRLRSHTGTGTEQSTITVQNLK